jgi:hypothetical protein
MQFGGSQSIGGGKRSTPRTMADLLVFWWDHMESIYLLGKSLLHHCELSVCLYVPSECISWYSHGPATSTRPDVKDFLLRLTALWLSVCDQLPLDFWEGRGIKDSRHWNPKPHTEDGYSGKFWATGIKDQATYLAIRLSNCCSSQGHLYSDENCIDGKK